MSRFSPTTNSNNLIFRKNIISQSLFLLLMLVFCSSCVSHQQLIDFRKTKEYIPIQDHKIENQIRITIQPDDILLIRVHSSDEISAEPYNLISNNAGSNLNESTSSLMGYLVDSKGYIDFPVFGKVKLSGLTTEEAKQLFVDLLENQLVNPVVNVRFINFKVTVLGEVNLPQTVSLFGEKVTILDILGTVGGFTPYSNKERVLLIREKDGIREFKTLDLHSPDLFRSPYFYLQQNDVIYVEPIAARTTTVRDPIAEILPLVSGVISLGALIITLLKIN